MRALMILLTLTISHQSLAGRLLDCRHAKLKCEQTEENVGVCKRNFKMCQRKEQGLSCYEIYQKRSRAFARTKDFIWSVLEIGGVVPPVLVLLTPVTTPAILAAAVLPKKGERVANYPIRLQRELRRKGQKVLVEHAIELAMRSGFGFGPGEFCENYPRLASVKTIKEYTLEKLSEENGIEVTNGTVVNVTRKARREERQQKRREIRAARRSTSDK